MNSHHRTVWFRYTHTRSRFTARPVAWQGWAVVSSMIGGMVALVAAANVIFAGVSIFLSLAAIFGALIVLIPLVKRVIIARGEAE